MTYLRAIYAWLCFILYTIMAFIVLWVIGIFYRLVNPDRLAHRMHEFACSWARGIVALIPGWNYAIEGAEHLPKGDDDPIIVTANHQSAVDILAIMVLSIQFRWLSKASVFNLPLIGLIMHWIDYIPIERGSIDSHKQALRRLTEKLKKGVSVVFFPEGTRSKTGKLKEFKVGAFKLSKEQDLPILPIALVGTRDMLEKDAFIPAPATMTIKVLPRVKINPGEDLEDFAARVRGMIAAELSGAKAAPLKAAGSKS